MLDTEALIERWYSGERKTVILDKGRFDQQLKNASDGDRLGMVKD